MTESFKRQVRLKEFGISVDRELAPTSAYLKDTNGTISEGPFRLRTDADGFIIGPQVEAAQGPAFYLLGDSFVEASFLPEGKRLTDRLTELDRDGQQRRFVNAGYSGATSLNNLSVLINKILPGDDIGLLYILPSNDILSLYNYRGFWNRADKRYSPLQPIVPETGTGPVPMVENLQQLHATLAAMAGVASAFNIRLYFSPCPFVAVGYEDLPWYHNRYRQPGRYEKLIADRQKANDVMRSVAARLRVPLIDLAEHLTDPALFYDEVHLNEAGSAFAARTIYANL